jgi:hypothetical protein
LATAKVKLSVIGRVYLSRSERSRRRQPPG